MLTLFLAMLAAAQLTVEGAGERIHRRAVATLTDVDRILPEIESQLDSAVEEGQTPAGRVPGFPIPVELTNEEARTLRGAALREHLLSGSARLLYKEGMSVWADGEPSGEQQISRVSTAGAIHRSLGLVRDSAHTVFVVSAGFLGLMCLLLAAGLALTIRPNYARLIVMGAVVLAASLPSLAAVVAIRFALKGAQNEADAFTNGMLALGIDAVWAPLRNYLWLSGLGSFMLLAGGLSMWLDSRINRGRGERPVTYADVPR
jgi:hypothetical protein